MTVLISFFPEAVVKKFDLDKMIEAMNTLNFNFGSDKHINLPSRIILDFRNHSNNGTFQQDSGEIPVIDS